MIDLQNEYNQEVFLEFLKNNFIKDFRKDIRPVISTGLKLIGHAKSLGYSKELDLQVFEFQHIGSPKKRVTLTKEAFQIMKQSATFNALAIFYSTEDKDWRFSLMTANPGKNEKGNVVTTYSNPRRFSFFLGPNAKVNTPIKFLIRQSFVTDFSDLKSRFSLEVVNKEFYREISHLFTQLVGGNSGSNRNRITYPPLLKLPSIPEHSQVALEFAVRLIGRVIFCWFLREKKSSKGRSLMPHDLLSYKTVIENEDYYHMILEPIFFEVLNKPLKSRKEKFVNDLFSSIPYLNGGLFSPHTDDFFNYNERKQSIYHNTVIVPNQWLKSLFEVLEKYNFTIDENISFDEELSIDPEMLGRIFENLLAEINPETGESARKSTGSYYTPRNIVDYMIDESLYLFLKEKTEIEDSKLKSLISYELDDDIENGFTNNEKERIINSLDKVKILDPACGSGAFPIGALQKIVFILQQVDPQGQLWFKKQIQNTSPEIKRVLEREFIHKNFDYIRKLGVIRENIYGIDIQPVAIEISRLRCFLTLIVEERIDESLENRGIEPLPNLDFKFVTSNSLIGLPTAKPVSQMDLFEDDLGIKELKEIRDMFFTASGFEREQLRLQFVQTQNRMFQRLISEGRSGYADLTTKLTSWDPFSHKAAYWFDSEWMFGIKDGFDIVIGNPPYVRADNPEFKELRQNIMKSGLYGTLYEKWDLFVPFIERGLQLLNSNGNLCYIVSNSLCTSKFAFKILEKIQKDYYAQFIDYFDDAWVFEAGVVPVVFGVSKAPINKFVRKTVHIGSFNNGKEITLIPIQEFKLAGKDGFKKERTSLEIISDTIELGDICYISVGMVLNADEKIAKGEFKVDDLISDVATDIHTKRYIEAKDIENWRIKKIRFLEWNTLRCPAKIRRKTFPELYDCPKLMVGSLTGGIYDDTGLLTHHGIVIFVRYTDLKDVNNKSISSSIKRHNNFSRIELDALSTTFNLKYLLAIINSKAGNYYLNGIRRHRLENYFYPDDFRKLPIPRISESEQQPFIDLVQKIIIITQAASFQQNIDAQNKVREYENKIDQMTYTLYGLSKESIKLIDDCNLEKE